MNLFFSLLLVVLFLPGTGLSQPQPPEVNWQEGPDIAHLGDNIAQVELGSDYLFANGSDTKKLMAFMGNPPTNQEVGLIVPRDESANYFILFQYSPVGYVRDDDKDKIDSDALLKSVQNATEQSNKTRVDKGFPAINVIGWDDPPHYDEESHNLVWTLLAESEGEQIVNYNVRLLGRGGYMSVVLVTDPSTLELYKQDIEQNIANFSYKDGNRYAEFVKGDKIAKYGLAALVAGGAGAAAAKAGFFKIFAKLWKFIILGFVAVFGGLWKKLKVLFVGEDYRETL